MKQFVTIILLSSVSYLYSCNTKIESVIQFEQFPSNLPVILSGVTYDSNIFMFELFTLNTIRKKTFLNDMELLSGGSIHYKDSIWQGGLHPYVFNNDELKYTESTNLSFFYNKQVAISYLVFINTSNKYYPLMKDEVERLRKSGQDTIHIGTIKELKNTNPIFFNAVLQADSIALQLWYKDLFQYVLLPIEMK